MEERFYYRKDGTPGWRKDRPYEEDELYELEGDFLEFKKHISGKLVPEDDQESAKPSPEKEDKQ